MMTDLRTGATKQAAAEANVKSFHDSLGPFVVAAEETRMAMVFTDAKTSDNPIIFANKSFLRVTGYEREEVLGRPFNSFASRADAAMLAAIKAEFSGGSETGSEFCYGRKDGSEFWATVLISPVRNESGEIVQHFASFVD